MHVKKMEEEYHRIEQDSDESSSGSVL